MINESRAFEISGSGNLSCNCESFGISDDKEMSSRNLDSIDAENLKQRGENASCSFAKVSLTAMINPVLPLPLQQYGSPMSFRIYEFETKRGKCPPVRSYKDKLKKWKFIIQCSYMVICPSLASSDLAQMTVLEKKT